MDSQRRARIEKKKQLLLKLAKAHKEAKRKAQKKDGKLPLSGTENEFTDLVWGSPEGVSGNNCYGYALGVYMDGGYRKLQPGELAGTDKDADDLTNCATLKRRTLEDLGKDGYDVSPEVACKSGYYKIMSVVDPGNDFHWYRQNGNMLVRADGKKTIANIAANAGVSKNSVRAGSNKPAKCDAVLLENAGLWTHKRGLDELTDKDASGKFITDPRKADRNYGKLRYTKYCNAFCVKNGFGSKHSR